MISSNLIERQTLTYVHKVKRGRSCPPGKKDAEEHRLPLASYEDPMNKETAASNRKGRNDGLSDIPFPFRRVFRKVHICRCCEQLRK